MSKAFVREDDSAEDPLPRATAPVLLPGEKNYLTPAGAHRLREAVAELKHERLSLAAPPVSAGARGELHEIDRRLRAMEESLRTAEIVSAPGKPWNVVRFGAIVRVRDPAGAESRYRIVGVDEADAARDCVSWRSPIARALLQAELGQKVVFEFPKGRTELEIVEITYP